MTQGKRRKVIMIETHQQTLIRSRQKAVIDWCEGCGKEVGMVSVGVAAREIGLSELSIYKLIESGSLHFVESADGHVLVCLNCLGQ